jgi:hypothetical protein
MSIFEVGSLKVRMLNVGVLEVGTSEDLFMKVLALEVGMDTRAAERTSPLGTDRGLIVVFIFARRPEKNYR